MKDIKIHWTVTIWPKWQIVLPKGLRETLGVSPWDSLCLLLKDNRYLGLVRNEDVSYLIEYINALTNK